MDEPTSKSQKKREADALQKMGVALIALRIEKLDTLPLSPRLKQAILEAKSLRSHGAIRRQAQWIGKLMRNENSDEIHNAYDLLLAKDNAQTASFHDVEHWRERLVSDDPSALTEFINTFPKVSAQTLRQLLKKTLDDKAKDQNTGASRALFRYIRSFIS